MVETKMHASSTSPSAPLVRGQLPTVLHWGNPVFAVQQSQDRAVYYPDGMQLEIHLADAGLIVLETIRVVDGRVEHRFEGRNVRGSSEWHRIRLNAFQQCVYKLCSRMNRPVPKRTIIFGPSHESIQSKIRERFASEITALIANKTKKRVSWGDDHPMVTDAPNVSHPYGGWGLETFHIIPNRFELREMMAEDVDMFFEYDNELLDDYEEEQDYFVEQAKDLDVDEVEADLAESAEPEELKIKLVLPSGKKRVLNRDADELTLYPSSDDDDNDEEEEEIPEGEEQIIEETPLFKKPRLDEGAPPQSLLEPEDPATIPSPPPVPMKDDMAVYSVMNDDSKEFDLLDQCVLHEEYAI